MPAPSPTGCFLGLVLSVSVNPELQTATFPLWIAAGRVVGMSCPTWFVGVGDFKFTRVFVPILQIILFGVGTTFGIGAGQLAAEPPGGDARSDRRRKRNKRDTGPSPR